VIARETGCTKPLGVVPLAKSRGAAIRLSSARGRRRVENLAAGVDPGDLLVVAAQASGRIVLVERVRRHETAEL
jgi:hypothetical protein